MLRIGKMEKAGRVVFALSGRIEERHIAELQELLDAETNAQPMTLDLGEVKLVDSGAVGFLAACESKGIKLEHCPAYIREWVTRERRGS